MATDGTRGRGAGGQGGGGAMRAVRADPRGQELAYIWGRPGAEGSLGYHAAYHPF